MFARTDERPESSPNRAGFALPLAILVIGLLTAAVAAGFAATASEAVINNAQRAQERAYQLAESGLQQFMVRRSETGFCTGCVTDPTAAVDSEYTRVQLNGGYADVVAKRIWNPTTGTDSPLFFIRSKGVDTAARISVGGGTVFAERTVGVYARWRTTTIKVLSTLTTFNGLTELSSGVVDSANTCPGTSVPNPSSDVMTLTGSGNVIGTGISVLSGPIDSINTAQSIDWNAIVKLNQLAVDITIPPGPWPSSYSASYWPIIRVKTSAAGTLPSSPAIGQGIIIADSNFTMPRNRTWNGIILVGGRLLSSGSFGTANIRGAIVTGLNRILPGAGTPPTGVATDNDSMGTGQRWRYNSCNVADAGLKFQGYSALTNTWMDNVAAW